ncbi:MAG: InlB B-repeat-containing protein [Bacteroidales bacterium]|nr:InlB B-repeat-containing protein [Bacteroidales bacterium]
MTLLEYVESQGGNKNNIVNTGIIFGTNSRVVMDVYIDSRTYSSYQSIAGVRNTTPNLALYSRFNGSNNFTVEYNNTAKGSVSGVYGERLTITITPTGVSFGNDTVPFTLSGNTQEAFNLFGCGFNGAASSEQSKMRLYSCTMYDGSTVVRNFLPVKDDSDVVCLYDTVSQGYFYPNASTLIAGPEAQATYTVIFNANGGTGSMPNQTMIVDVSSQLNLNTFTKSGKQFAGWSTEPDGEVVYSDGQTVINLAEEGESITLYAVWGIQPFLINLYRNNSEKNKIGKDIVAVATLTGFLRAETSIIDPDILVECNLEDVALVNYMYIPKFERYYFITNITSVRTDLVQFEAHCDVLESFKDYILGNEAIIKRQTSLFNIYQDDKSMVFKDPPIVQLKAFPDGFEGFSYVLYVAGGGESDVSYVWVIETTHNTAMDAFTPEGSDGGTGGKYLRGGYPGTMPDHFVTLGSYLFRSNWDRIGAWLLMLVGLDYTSTYLGGDDLEHRIVIPESDSIQVWRNGGGADDVNQVSLKVYANSTEGQPQSLTAYDMYSHTSDATAQTISLPNDFKYLRFEWSQHV